uniref:Uncharacterized protein n=1 Tax=Arundo donax TaxID=35708 RepID=A0A0A9AUX4_ARUDO
MEPVQLAPQAILSETLKQLGFSQEVYTHETINRTHCQAFVFFSAKPISTVDEPHINVSWAEWLILLKP